MAQTISGTITEVLDIEQGTSKSGNAWQKQTFALTTGGMYPDTIAFELFGDRVGQFGHLLHKDSIVTVEYYPKSQRWPNPKTGAVRYFTSLSVGSMYPAAAAAQQAPPQPAPQAYQQQAPAPAPAAAPDPTAAPELPF